MKAISYLLQTPLLKKSFVRWKAILVLEHFHSRVELIVRHSPVLSTKQDCIGIIGLTLMHVTLVVHPLHDTDITSVSW